MAVVSKDVSARIRLTDATLKTVASFSGVDMEIEPSSVMAFRNGINALVTKDIANQYLYISTEISKEEEA